MRASDRDAANLLRAIDELERVTVVFTYLPLSIEARHIVRHGLGVIRAALYARRTEYGLPLRPARRAA